MSAAHTAVLIFLATATALVASLLSGCGEQPAPPAQVDMAFYTNNTLHFTPSDTAKYDTATVYALDNGRIAATYAELDPPRWPARLMARLTLKPIPKDIRNVHDRWDRAGHIRLEKPGMAPVEVVKFMTSYGGRTEHEVDVTPLLPLFDGHCELRAFIDTWVSPAWQIDFALRWVPDPTAAPDRPDWVAGAFFEQQATAASRPDGGWTAPVTVPEGVGKVVLRYFTSGHCTDGRDADEFVTKDNVITVDGREVYRFRPWRDDCRQFREINPYCARWSDGSWSSDYSRSNWCPGDVVLPEEIDLSAWLTPGDHVVGFDIEDIRPEDADGNFGYWRVSGHLCGWR